MNFRSGLVFGNDHLLFTDRQSASVYSVVLTVNDGHLENSSTPLSPELNILDVSMG